MLSRIYLPFAIIDLNSIKYALYFFLNFDGCWTSTFSHPKCLGVPFCAICNSNSIHSLIFKLCIIIVHTFKMCTSYFVRVSYFFKIILTGVRHFFHPKCFGGGGGGGAGLCNL